MFPEGSPRGPRDAPGPLFDRFWMVLGSKMEPTIVENGAKIEGPKRYSPKMAE